MSKLPFMKFYVNDYLRDTRHLSLAAKGAWTDLLFFMWPKGSYEGSRAALCRAIGLGSEDLDAILLELQTVATVTDRNSVITVMSRRLTKEKLDRENSTIRQAIHRRNAKVTPLSHENNSLDVRSQMSEVRSQRPDVNVNNERGSAPRFQKPTAEEIAAYAKSEGLNLDAKHFFDHYESNGWKVNRNAMKDWKATVRNWARRDKKHAATTNHVRLDQSDPKRVAVYES